MQVTTTPGPVPTQPTIAPTSQSANALSSDFETFLRMLTTQMENQDPLNPIESSDFAVQLATFSGVEQQIRTNDLLTQMVAGLGSSGLTQLAGWVGMEARVSGPVAFQGSPISLAPEPDPGADSATLVVRDAGGREVGREALPLGREPLEWAGVAAGGGPLAPGVYTLEIESHANGEILSVKPVEHYAAVREARLGDEGVEIVLAGGIVVKSQDVRALRAPDAGS